MRRPRSDFVWAAGSRSPETLGSGVSPRIRFFPGLISQGGTCSPPLHLPTSSLFLALHPSCRCSTRHALDEEPVSRLETQTWQRSNSSCKTPRGATSSRLLRWHAAPPAASCALHPPSQLHVSLADFSILRPPLPFFSPSFPILPPPPCNASLLCLLPILCLYVHALHLPPSSSSPPFHFNPHTPPNPVNPHPLV